MCTCSALGSVIVQTPVFPEECLAQACELSLFLQVPSTVAKMQRLGHQVSILMWEINNKKGHILTSELVFNTKKAQGKTLHLCEGTHKHGGNSQPREDWSLTAYSHGSWGKIPVTFWPVQLLCLHCAAHPCDWSFKGSHWSEGGAEALSLPSHKPMPECFSSSASHTGPPSKQKCQTIWYLSAGWLPFLLGREGSMQ